MTKNKQPRTANIISGGFFQSKGDRGVEVHTTDADELTKPDPNEAAIRLAEGPAATGRLPTKTRKRRTKLAVLGIPAGAIRDGDPAYARCVKLAQAYRKIRVRELVISHGYVSSAVSAFLGAAALALASSRYLYEKAAERGAENLDIFKTASRLADSARQNELAAWELCAREAVASKRNQVLGQGAPWLVQDDDSGYGRGKPGPKKRDITLPSLPPIGKPLDGWVQEVKIEDA